MSEQNGSSNKSGSDVADKVARGSGKARTSIGLVLTKLWGPVFLIAGIAVVFGLPQAPWIALLGFVLLAVFLARRWSANAKKRAMARARLQPASVSGSVAGIVPVNTMALLALIFAFLPTGPLCVIFGHVGLAQIRRTGERGRGMAIAGLVLGYLWLAAIAAVVLFFVALGASFA